MKQSNEFIFLHVTWGRISLILIAWVLTFTIALAYRAALPASAAGPWYVAPGGSDGNSCLNDGSPCATINGAIGKASAGDTIYVATGTYTSSSYSEVVLVDKNVILSGGWDTDFSNQIGYSIIDGQGARLGITVGNYVDATIERFTIQNGRGGIRSFSSNLIVSNSNLVNNIYLPGDPYNKGGGIDNLGGTLVITNSVVSGNVALYSGGISNSGWLTVTNSIISGNTAGQAGIGGTAAVGSGIYNGWSLVLINSSVSGNAIEGNFSGGGVSNYSGISMTAINSTISNNTNGPGIFSFLTSVSLNNSTVSNNQGAGLRIDFSTASLNSSTINGNQGYGISDAGISTLTLQNTILANNGVSFGGVDCNRTNMTVNSLGYNLIQKNINCILASTDLVNVDPRLISLMGSPGYHPLLRNSPAIDAGNPSGCTDHLGNPLDTDQRGVARVGRCDIGSYEYDPANDPLHYIYLPFIFEYFCSDFFDDFSNPSSGWLIGEDDVLRAEYLSGEYRVLVKQTGSTLVFRAPTCNHQNYILEVDGRWGGNPGASYGLIFGIVGDFEQFYTLEVYPDVRGLALYRYVSGTWSEIWSHTDLAFIWDENHLKLTRNGDAIDLEVNGTTIVPTFYDSTITGMTGVGLIVSSFSDLPNADARFDNFSVSKVSGSVTVGNRQNGNAGSAEPQASFRMLENAESAELERRSPER